MLRGERTLESNWVLKRPIWYLLILILAVLPYFVVDYQTCYLIAKASNANVSLLNFIQHVIIEKFATSIAMATLLFGAVFLVHNKEKARSKTDELFGQRLRRYVSLSLLYLFAAYIVYSAVFWLILDFFPDHHGPLSIRAKGAMFTFNTAHFGVLGFLLVGANTVGSLRRNKPLKIEVQGKIGKSVIPIDSIDWITKQDELYIIQAGNKSYRTNKTINAFEKMLDRNKFIRINRAAIVRIATIEDYSYWENDKYMLRTKGFVNHEFVVSRQRMKVIKKVLLTNV